MGQDVHVPCYDHYALVHFMSKLCYHPKLTVLCCCSATVTAWTDVHTSDSGTPRKRDCVDNRKNRKKHNSPYMHV